MAGRKHETRVIDGLEFTCQQSSFERAFPLAPRAAGLFAVKGEDVAASTLIALAVFQRDPTLLGELLAGTQVVHTVEGRLVNESLSTQEARNRVFSGRLETAFKAALFAAEVEFRDFFGGVFGEQTADGDAETKAGETDAPSS
jgi:hypothetical protein